MTKRTPPLAPEVSVIVPAYNEAGLLEKCIEAITGQLETIGAHFELLVVDDGSTDGTALCLQDLADADDSPTSALNHFLHLLAVSDGTNHSRHIRLT